MNFKWRSPSVQSYGSGSSIGGSSGPSTSDYVTDLSAAFSYESWEGISVANHFIQDNVELKSNTEIINQGTATFHGDDEFYNYTDTVLSFNGVMADTTSPTITITGATTITLTLNSKYTINSATASDNYGRVIPISISSNRAIDTSQLDANYMVTYTATDSSYNTATETRTVTIIQAEAPTVFSGDTSGSGSGTITGTLTASDEDGLTDGSIFTISSQGSNGTGSIHSFIWCVVLCS